MKQLLNYGFLGFLITLTVLSCLAQNPIPIQANASATRAGTIFIHYAADKFPIASEQAPVYLRILFDKGGQLAETLVWDHPNNGDPETRLPIYLAFRVEDQLPGSALTPNTGLRIVRWKAGETAIWLEISKDFPQWLAENGLPASTILQWGFGDNQANNVRFFAEAYGNNLANLPGNTRDAFASDASAVVGTELFLKTDQGSLIEPDLSTADVDQAIQNCYLSFFSSRTTGVQTAEHMREIDLGGVVLSLLVPFGNAVPVGFVPQRPDASRETGGNP